MLSDRFHKVLFRAGIPHLTHPIFYNAPIGIRFEIGADEPVYITDSADSEETMNPKYVAMALKRAYALYVTLPHPPDILRIDTYPDEERARQDGTIEKLVDLGLCRPQEQKSIYVRWEADGDTVKQLQSYWNVTESFRPQTLLREIIKADIGGISALVSNVYFVNSVDFVLFHLYDDRGADLIASNKEPLRPIFEKFNDWILDYDKEQVKRTFAK